MDYEKKYKEALEQAKKELAQSRPDSDSARQILRFFPELTESEDERVRKVIYKLILGMREEIFTAQDEIVTKEKALAYLEKKPDIKIWPHPIKDAYLEQKEQKSAEWSEEDIHNLNSVISLVHSTSDGAWGSCIGDRIENWLKNLPERFNLQPKNEWSEEDEKKLERVIWYVEKGCSMIFQKSDELIAWLKSLRPQPKVEWNKQDVDMLNWLIRCCEKEHEELCNDKYGHQDIISDLKGDCRRKWDWLESLKNKVVPQPHWKPSEEQLEAMEYVIRDYREDSCNATANYLQEILDHLRNM